MARSRWVSVEASRCARPCSPPSSASPPPGLSRVSRIPVTAAPPIWFLGSRSTCILGVSYPNTTVDAGDALLEHGRDATGRTLLQAKKGERGDALRLSGGSVLLSILADPAA